MTTRALILAAGKGSRMNSKLPKVCTMINGKTFLQNIIDALNEANIINIYPIIGYRKDIVLEMHDFSNFFVQKEINGTAKAVEAASSLKEEDGSTIVICGDIPLIKPDTIIKLVSIHNIEQNDLTFLTINSSNIKEYGRILRKNGKIVGQVEQFDATEEEKLITELNVSVYCFNNKLMFEYLPMIKNNNAKGEYYINDLIGIFANNNLKIATVEVEDITEVTGINDRETLNRLNTL